MQQRQEGQAYLGETGWSVRTTNAHLRAVKSFCRWITQKRVLPEDPVHGEIDAFGGNETDIRRPRRALTTSEIFRLLRMTVQENAVREGMDGIERALLYEFAIKVGARVNAIRHLRVCDFDFDCPGGPIVRLLAAHSKTHTTHVQPLEPDLTAKLTAFIRDRGKQSDDLLFRGTFKTLTVFTARILKEDIEAAQLQYKTDEGYADFHALKHTFASSLRGLDDTDKMALTGHKRRESLDRYDHRTLNDKRASLAQIKQWGTVG
jgi:integrase